MVGYIFCGRIYIHIINVTVPGKSENGHQAASHDLLCPPQTRLPSPDAISSIHTWQGFHLMQEPHQQLRGRFERGGGVVLSVQ